MADKLISNDDEIQLKDFLQLFWEWRVFIVKVTLFCAVLAGIYSYFYLSILRGK